MFIVWLVLLFLLFIYCNKAGEPDVAFPVMLIVGAGMFIGALATS